MITVAAPLGLLALLALPAIVALHLWRARYRERRTSALFLYGPPPQVLASGRNRSPLRNRASLWLELLAALALAWWLADVRIAPQTAGRHEVHLIDTRWRMQAVDEAGGSVRDRVLARLRARIAAWGEDDRGALVLSGRPPRLLAGPDAPAAILLTALDRAACDGPWHELDDGIALARQIAGGGIVTCWSDRAGLAQDDLGWEAVGVDRPASGLAEARWWRDAGGDRLVVRLAGDPGTRRTLLLRTTAGEQLAQAELVADAAPSVLALRDPPAQLELALAGEDPLAVDDRAILPRPPARTVRWRIDLPAAAAAPWRRALAAVPGTASDNTAADLTIAGPGPAAPWTLRVAPADGAPVLGPFLARAGHPLLDGVDAAGLLWNASAGPGFPAGEVLLAAGDRVLLSAADAPAGPAITWHGDPLRAGTAAHPAFPGIVSNLVAWRRSRLPGPSTSAVPAGAAPELAVVPGTAEVELTPPGGGSLRLFAAADGTVRLPPFTLPGLWTIAAGGLRWEVAALPIEPRMAGLAGAATASVPALGAGAAHRAGLGPRRRLEHLLPLLVAALAALAAWAAFRREEGA